ncbi:MAG: ABC transporter substrate-binding protein [Oscillospiraceae bacterium]
MANKIKRPLLIALAAALIVGAFSGCAQDSNSEAPLPDFSQSETVRPNQNAADNVFSLNCDREISFNPFTTTNSSNIICTQLMYDTLFELDESFTPTVVLIKNYKSDDGKCWYFDIDPDVKFWDGSALTAQDAAYSIQRAMRSPQFSARLKCIIGVSAIDEKTFVINLSYVDMQFPALLNIPVIKYGTAEDFTPMGTGPYKPDEGLTKLSAFSEHKNAEKLPVDTVYLKEYKIAEDIISAFENSEIDLVTNDPTGFFNLGYGSANEIRSFATTNMHYLGFNSKSTFFSNQLFRKAMAYVVDRDHIVSDVLGGAASAATLPINPTSPAYNDSYSENISYSVKKCEAALDAAEVQDYDTDGRREIKVTGIPVELDIKFVVCNDSPTKVAAARAIAKNMDELGITVTLHELSWDSYISALSNGNFDMYYAETKMTSDFSPRELLRTGGKLNYGKFSDPVLEENINAYMASKPEGRQEAANNMFKQITDTAPIVTICFEKQQVITHRGVITGMKPTQANVFHGLDKWKITMN